MTALYIQRLNFITNKGIHHNLMGISSLNDFSIEENIHFGIDNCLVGISVATTRENKINSIKFWY